MSQFIDKQQRNILIMLAVVISSILVFFVFIYSPTKAKIHQLKNQLKSVGQSLVDIQAIAPDRKDLGRAILNLRQESNFIESRFIKPDEVAASLEMLSEFARQAGIEVVSVQPSEFKPCYAVKPELLQSEGLECNKVSIDINLVGAYKALTGYIERLEANVSPQLSVRRFDIDKYQAPSRLRAHIVVDSFALMPKKAAR